MFSGNPFQAKKSKQHDFSIIPSVETPRSSFNRSHGTKTAFDSGFLVPIYVDEVLPGDTFNLKLSAVGRLSTPIAPFMDNLYLDFFFFYVPLRLLQTNFKKLMGEQANPSDSVSYIAPYTTINTGVGYAVGSLHDYMGLPTDIDDFTHNTYHLRAYNKIWNDWFRDENLQNSVTENMGDGPDTYTDYVLLKRGKRKDYFTSCLPWPQKATAVSIPLGTTAPVLGIGALDTVYGSAGTTVYESDGTTSTYTQSKYVRNSTSDNNAIMIERNPSNTNYPYIRADLSNATAATINQLRQAFQLQKLYERDARGGTRYTEIVRSHFGVTSEDGRLQRPELLAQGTKPIQLNIVPQTSPTSGSNAMGNLAAFGAVNVSGIGFTKSFTEHGVLLGLASVRADLTYQQGLHRMWSRSTKTDFYWPSLAHIGEQSVLNKEIYCAGSGAGTDDSVFGYQERYAEYRFKPSQVTGKLRSTASGTLDLWHLAQKFTSLPTLGDTFIKESPPISRVVAVNTEPQIIMDAYFNLVCARPMPVYSVPGLIDHF